MFPTIGIPRTTYLVALAGRLHRRQRHTTYALLYRTEILAQLRQLPGLNHSRSIRRVNRLAGQWLRILLFIPRHHPRFTVLLVLSALFGVAIGMWKLPSRSTRTPFIVSLVIIIVALVFVVAYLRWIRIRKRLGPG